MTPSARSSATLLLLFCAARSEAQRAGSSVPPGDSCARISGIPSVSVSVDEGLSWSANPRHMQQGQATFGLVALDSGRWLAEFEGTLFHSQSGGCPMGLDLDENLAGLPSEGRHVYRSVDGGLSFVPVVDHRADAVLINGPVLAPHPGDPDVLYFPFGSRFEGGVWLYRYDQSTGATSANFSADFFQIRALAVDPLDPARVLAGFEG